MVYVDDLLFTGEEQEINRIFEQIQQHMLLRPTGESTPGSTVSFLGRQITNRGNYYEITLGDSYIDNILQEACYMQSRDNTGNNNNKGDR